MLEPNDSRHLAILCGQFDQHLKQIESRLGVRIKARGNEFSLIGDADPVTTACKLLTLLYQEICEGVGLSPESLHLQLHQAGLETLMAETTGVPGEDGIGNLAVIRTKRASVKPRGKNQQSYVRIIGRTDINFGIGPAGTGKTYLAVACAVEALLNDQVHCGRPHPVGHTDKVLLTSPYLSLRFT